MTQTLLCASLAAITMADALAAHALKAFDTMGADDALEGARAIRRWFERECLEHFTRRDVQRGNKNRFRNVAEVNAALRVLEERAHVRITPTNAGPRGGRPSEKIEVNPLAMG